MIDVDRNSFFSRIVDFLSDRPSDDEILALKATEEESRHIQRLFVLDQGGVATEEESRELYDLQIAEHIIGIAKIKAMKRKKSLAN